MKRVLLSLFLILVVYTQPVNAENVQWEYGTLVSQRIQGSGYVNLWFEANSERQKDINQSIPTSEQLVGESKIKVLDLLGKKGWELLQVEVEKQGDGIGFIQDTETYFFKKRSISN